MKIIYIVAGLVLSIDVVILMLFGPLKRTRVVAGMTLLLSSLIFGLATWLIGLIATLHFWGIVPVMIGLIFLGIGVIPIGLLACAVNCSWGHFWGLLLLMALTFMAKWISLWLLATMENQSENSSTKINDTTIVDI